MSGSRLTRSTKRRQYSDESGGRPTELTQPVAAKHYLQVTDEHFSKALQDPLQQPHAMGRNESRADSTAHENTPVLQGFAAACDRVQDAKVGDEGLEPPTQRGGRGHRQPLDAMAVPSGAEPESRGVTTTRANQTRNQKILGRKELGSIASRVAKVSST